MEYMDGKVYRIAKTMHRQLKSFLAHVAITNIRLPSSLSHLYIQVSVNVISSNTAVLVEDAIAH